MINEKMPCRCFKCRKTPKNCVCFVYRIVEYEGYIHLYVDNVARDPVRGEDTGMWQPRKNAKITRRPIYEDGFGPIIIARDPDIAIELREAVENGTFHIDTYRGRRGCSVREYDRNNARSLGFLRKPRKGRVGKRTVAV